MNNSFACPRFGKVKLDIIDKAEHSGGELHPNVVLAGRQDPCPLFSPEQLQEMLFRLLLCASETEGWDVMCIIRGLAAHAVRRVRAWHQPAIPYPQIRFAH